MWWKDLLYLLSALSGSCLTLFLKYLINKKGKIIISARTYSDSNKAVHVYNNTLCVPIEIEVINSKNIDFIIRNIKLELYNNGKQIDTFIQSIKSQLGDKTKYFANNGSYSFLVQKKNLISLKCFYFLYKNDTNTIYDDLVLSYYDFNNKVHKIYFTTLEKGWNNQEKDVSFEWKELKEIKNS